MDTFLNKHDILSPSQYGFRSNMSTSHALLELVDEITSSLYNKKYSVGICIDFKKAFDHDYSIIILFLWCTWHCTRMVTLYILIIITPKH